MGSATLEEAASRARHDLGKYISFAARWVEPSADIEALRSALEEDLLHTRKGPSGVVGAVELWAELRGPLVGVSDEVDRLMAEIVRGAPQLGALDRAGLEALAGVARQVADALRRLHVKVRAG